ncbi:MAG: RbsD/FucU family protein [Opitutaceae bacterium]|jgi:D-ribose pyranase|nr:RbsD/FucU family protein [Opitutaceae bacterium]
MLRSGILNPALLSLLARVRHTNTLIIADRGFPSWPGLDTIDLSLVDDVPTVAQVVAALRENFVIGAVHAAEELKSANSAYAVERHLAALRGLPVHFEPHLALKARVPRAVGLVRTGDTTQYANLVIESA